MQIFSLKSYDTLQKQLADELKSAEGFTKWRNIFNELRDMNEFTFLYEHRYERDRLEFNDICNVFEKDFMFSNKNFSDFYKSNKISSNSNLFYATFNFFLACFVSFVKRMNYIYNDNNSILDCDIFDETNGLHLVLNVNENIEKYLCEKNIGIKRFGKTYNCFIDSKKIILHEFFMKEIKHDR